MEKDAFIHPERVLQDMRVVEPGMKVADFGCGAGYFSIALARLVGNTGRVYALDILKGALSIVESKAKQEGLFQIETILCDIERLRSSTIADGEVDAVLIANMLFQVGKKDMVLQEAFRVLRRNGFLMVIEWQEGGSAGPPAQSRVSKQELQTLAERTGFAFAREFPAGKYHYGILFTKS